MKLMSRIEMGDAALVTSLGGLIYFTTIDVL